MIHVLQAVATAPVFACYQELNHRLLSQAIGGEDENRGSGWASFGEAGGVEIGAGSEMGWIG